MTREEAEARCTELAETHPDRETHQWRPREQDDGTWAVVKIGLPPLPESLIAETRADERPDTPADPRPDVPPYSAGF